MIERAHGRAEVPFTPGAAATLHSADGSVTVQAPGNLFARPLTLTHLPKAVKLPILRARGERIPPDVAGFRRGFETFFLEATDTTGADIHQFDAPLAISVTYTPEQLQAYELSEADLTLYWFDATRPITHTSDMVTIGAWVALPTTIDTTTHTASTAINHFTPLQLSDGSSPSDAFIPSLQGWQVSGFTGAASYSYPIDLPAGPGGLKPSLTLNYSSAAVDGPTGQRVTKQAGWVGNGWSLDTGSIAVNKLLNENVYYTLVLNGQSYDLIRGDALVGTPSDTDPTDWDWRATDESFIRVRAIANGGSSATRGGYQVNNPAPDNAYARYTWQVWTKDGTRYDFSEDAWWGWDSCPGNANMEAYKWALSSTTDTHGNTISYQYGRNSVTLGTISFTYENVGEQANNGLMNNYRRVKTKTLGDGRGNNYTWTYTYGTPNINSLGTERGPLALEWDYGNYGTQPYPNSAALYYNAFVNTSYDQRSWLVHQPMKEFCGHDYMAEIDPNGTQTEHWFHQGEAVTSADLPDTSCVPTITGDTIPTGLCFQELRDGEFLYNAGHY